MRLKLLCSLSLLLCLGTFASSKERASLCRPDHLKADSSRTDTGKMDTGKADTGKANTGKITAKFLPILRLLSI